MRYTSYMRISEGNGTTSFYQTGPTKRNRTLTILFPFSEFPIQEKHCSEPVCRKRKRKFRSDRSDRRRSQIFDRKKPKWIFHLTSDRNCRDLWDNENTSGPHVLVHCSMASEVMEFSSFFYFYQLGRYYRMGIFAI